MNKTVYIIIGAWLAFLLVSMLTGCRTKTIAEFVAVHDTLMVSKTDTCYKVRVERIADTVMIETEHSVTLNEGGETIRVAIYRDRWRDRWNVRTDTVMRATIDTVYLSKDTDTKKVADSGVPWWERWTIVLAIIVFSIFWVHKVR